MTAEYKVIGDVAVITMSNPPVNGLGLSTRIGITDGLTKANSDAAVKSIIITVLAKPFRVVQTFVNLDLPKPFKNLICSASFALAKILASLCWRQFIRSPWGAVWSWHWDAITASLRLVARWHCPK
jgi:hypothetical protein